MDKDNFTISYKNLLILLAKVYNDGVQNTTDFMIDGKKWVSVTKYLRKITKDANTIHRYFG